MSAAVEITKTPTVIVSLIKYQHEAGLKALYVTGSVTNNDEGMTWQVSAGDAIALRSAGKRAQPPACQQENAWHHEKVTSSISTSACVCTAASETKWLGGEQCGGPLHKRMNEDWEKVGNGSQVGRVCCSTHESESHC